MFPTTFVPPALFGLSGLDPMPISTTLDLTAVVVALTIGAITASAALWLHTRQEAKPLTRRTRPQVIHTAPATA